MEDHFLWSTVLLALFCDLICHLSHPWIAKECLSADPTPALLRCYLGRKRGVQKEVRGGFLDSELGSFAPQPHASQLRLLEYPPVCWCVFWVVGNRAALFLMMCSLVAGQGSCPDYHYDNLVWQWEMHLPLMILFFCVSPLLEQQQHRIYI